jgi:hypothetical protein
MTKMITFHVPDDQAVLAAFGEVALRHEHMNHILKMTIKTLANLTVEEALAALEYESSSNLRDRVRNLARKRLGEGKALLKLQAIIGKCKQLTDRRNALIHGLWAQELDGEAHVRGAFGETAPTPTKDELKVLASEIQTITNHLNEERLHGFLQLALVNKGPKI